MSIRPPSPSSVGTSSERSSSRTCTGPSCVRALASPTGGSASVVSPWSVGSNPIDTRPGPTPLTDVPIRGAIASTATTTNASQPSRRAHVRRRDGRSVVSSFTTPTLGAEPPMTREVPVDPSDDGNRSISVPKIAESLEIQVLRTSILNG